MRWQMAYPTESALPNKPGGAMKNQTANTMIAASGTSQRVNLWVCDCDVVSFIPFIIWAYTMKCKKDCGMIELSGDNISGLLKKSPSRKAGAEGRTRLRG